MAFRIRRVNYFYASVANLPGAAYDLLSHLGEMEVNLLAFTALPVGPARTQLTLFPEDDGKLEGAAQKAGLALDGPHPALMAQGDDELGALERVHQQLAEAGIEMYASSGVADGEGRFGYVIYIRPSDYEKAAGILGV